MKFYIILTIIILASISCLIIGILLLFFYNKYNFRFIDNKVSRESDLFQL